LEKLSFQEFLSLSKPLILITEGLEGIHSTKDELNNSIRLEFTSTEQFGGKKQKKKRKGFVRQFNSEKSKHLINGLDREIVYVRDWLGYVDPGLDGFSLGDPEHGSP
jgi:hypothetical protein